LGQFLVSDHLCFKSNEHFLHGGLGVPVSEKVEFGGLDDAVGLVHGGDVDLGGELGGHGDGGVLGPALDLHEVDAVVEVGVGGSDNSSVPVGEVVVSG